MDISRTKLSASNLDEMLASRNEFIRSDGTKGRYIELVAKVIENYDFSGLDLSDVDARGSAFRNCVFKKSDLYGALFSYSEILDCDFSGAVLSKSQFHKVVARGNKFDGCTMSQIEFIDSDLSYSSFVAADVSQAIISECRLLGVSFLAADLSGTNVDGGANYYS